MTVMENFGLGLRVTGLGMLLVFFALFVVMAAIWLLDRAFRPRGERESSATAPAVTPVASVLPSSPIVPKKDLAGVAAAIGVAIALQRAPAPVRTESPEHEQDLPSSVVTVATIDPGPGTWRGYGRVKAMQ